MRLNLGYRIVYYRYKAQDLLTLEVFISCLFFISYQPESLINRKQPPRSIAELSVIGGGYLPGSCLSVVDIRKRLPVKSLSVR